MMTSGKTHFSSDAKKPLIEYLSEYMATGINRAHAAGMPVDFTKEGLKLIFEDAFKAYESIKNVKIKIEK